MSEAGNGHIARVERVEADTRDLRQLLMDEMRHVRGELRDIKTTLDILLAIVQLEEEQNDG